MLHQRGLWYDKQHLAKKEACGSNDAKLPKETIPKCA